MGGERENEKNRVEKKRKSLVAFSARNGGVGSTTKHRREQEDNGLIFTPDRASRQKQD